MSNTGTALCVFCAFSVASTLRAVATSQILGGSVAEWLACWTQAQKGLS